jgi:serine/threonine protein kinase HipA of HipAB toxin-antitoxin module
LETPVGDYRLSPAYDLLKKKALEDKKCHKYLAL